LSNWALLQEQLVGKQVVKRAKHGIHFDNGDGQILAKFSGRPCHYLDGGLWKPIDTKLLIAGDGYYGCPHSKVRVHPDGHVKVDGSHYKQYTPLVSSKSGLVDNDRIVRKFSFGEQRMWVTEDGFRSEIQINRIPTLTEARKLVASETGILSVEYLKSLTTATDANGDSHTFSTLSAFRTWLASAVFPVVIDPDFAGGTADGRVSGANADVNVARSTSSTYNASDNTLTVGSYISGITIYISRGFVLFDTSTIGIDSTITQVNLKLTTIQVNQLNGNYPFDIQIVKQDWSGQNPLSDDNREAAYDNCLSGTADDSILRNTSGIEINTQYTSGNLSIAWVSKTGTTYYSLRSSLDFNNGLLNISNRLSFASANHATESYRPVLTVTYTEAGGLHRINMNAQMQSLNGGMHG